MRHRWTVVAMLLGCLSGLVISAGPANAELAGTARTDDGYGVRIGAADAPVQLEVFCEPQCPVCADFEATSNDQLVRELGAHRLAVTYRWLTFLDERRGNDASARLARALLLAGDPATAPIAYQNFVAEVYRRQQRTGDGPTPEQIAAMARGSGVPGPIADRIAAADPGSDGIDTAAVDAGNHRRLSGLDAGSPGTPTVYDVTANRVVDTEEPGWLDRLMQAG